MKIIINVEPDGNQSCAIIGNMPTEDAIGFGDTIYEALKNLIKDMKTHKERCNFCWSTNTEIKIVANGTYIKCKDCGYLGGNTWDEYNQEASL